MEKIYKPVLAFFQLVADVPGYEEMVTFVASPDDDEESARVEEVTEQTQDKDGTVKT